MKVKVKSLSRVRLFATPWIILHQAPPSMRFSRQEYWSGLPFPSPGNLPNPGTEPRSPTLQADALTSEPPEGIPVELFQILKDDAVKVLHSICQQIWKTQHWPQDWKRSVFIPVSFQCQRMLKLPHNCTHLTH